MYLYATFNSVADDVEQTKIDESNIEQAVIQNEWRTFESTAYTAFCDTGCIGITRTGYDVSETIYYEGMRVIAVDPDVIPLYSIVEIKAGETTFTAIALDTGAAIQGEIIDLLVTDKETAYKWGRREVKIRIMESDNE